MIARTLLFITVLVTTTLILNAEAQTTYSLTVLPSESKKMTDPQTGVELTFLTTAPSKDTNLYFHDRSWLSDGSMILFVSDRPQGGLMGYLTATGELVSFDGHGKPLGSANAAGDRPAVLAIRENNLVEIAVEVTPSSDPKKAPSKVTAHERIIASLPAHTAGVQLSENSDNKFAALGSTWTDLGGPGIFLVDEANGAVKEVCKINDSIGYDYHLQWSHTDPHIMSFAGKTSRLWMVDTRDGKPKSMYSQVKDELVTHESWWVNDQLIFCGGTHPLPNQDSDVKILDTHTGIVRIIGAGSWWQGATPEQLAKVNWWHADGSDDGRWVVADNWHGDIMLFEGKTSRPHLLTSGHRTYGKGEHPHVGFDRANKQVVFASSLLGDTNVCVATIPKEWQDQNP